MPICSNRCVRIAPESLPRRHRSAEAHYRRHGARRGGGEGRDRQIEVPVGALPAGGIRALVRRSWRARSSNSSWRSRVWRPTRPSGWPPLRRSSRRQSRKRINKQKPARRPLPEHLPREEVHHPAACSCPHCGGALRRIGEDVTETLDYVPGRFKVIRHGREKLSCRACDTVIAAPAPDHAIARGRGPPLSRGRALCSRRAAFRPAPARRRRCSHDVPGLSDDRNSSSNSRARISDGSGYGSSSAPEAFALTGSMRYDGQNNRVGVTGNSVE